MDEELAIRLSGRHEVDRRRPSDAIEVLRCDRAVGAVLRVAPVAPPRGAVDPGAGVTAEPPELPPPPPQPATATLQTIAATNTRQCSGNEVVVVGEFMASEASGRRADPATR